MFRIYNSDSGAELGTYAGTGSASAYLAMLTDANAFDGMAAGLQGEAVYAGDWRAVALCQRARGRDVGAGHIGSMDPDAIAHAESFTQDQARAIVAGMLLDGSPDIVVVSAE